VGFRGLETLTDKGSRFGAGSFLFFGSKSSKFPVWVLQTTLRNKAKKFVSLQGLGWNTLENMIIHWNGVFANIDSESMTLTEAYI
jgi:hypothetical protein